MDRASSAAERGTVAGAAAVEVARQAATTGTVMAIQADYKKGLADYIRANGIDVVKMLGGKATTDKATGKTKELDPTTMSMAGLRRLETKIREDITRQMAPIAEKMARNTATQEERRIHASLAERLKALDKVGANLATNAKRNKVSTNTAKSSIADAGSGSVKAAASTAVTPAQKRELAKIAKEYAERLSAATAGRRIKIKIDDPVFMQQQAKLIQKAISSEIVALKAKKSSQQNEEQIKKLQRQIRDIQNANRSMKYKIKGLGGKASPTTGSKKKTGDDGDGESKPSFKKNTETEYGGMH